MMKAVIMAGGKGTRLSSVTGGIIPKPMVAIAEKPLLEIQVEQLRENRVIDILIVIGHLGNVIKEYFGDGKRFGVHISYFQEKEPLGSAGALAFVRDWLGGSAFLLIYGDILFHMDFQKMVQFHVAKGADITLVSHPNDHPYDSDIVLKDEESRVQGFLKKNITRDFYYDNCVNAGIYMVEAKTCSTVEKGVEADFAHDILIPAVKNDGQVYAYSTPEYVKDVGTPSRLAEAEAAFVDGLVEAKDLRNKQKAVFLDRDGTVNKLKGFVFREEDIELENHAAEAIKKINHSGYLAVIITNQPSVARGLCGIKDIERNHLKLKALLGSQGAYVDGIYYCPHHPDKGYPEENKDYKIDCTCRKPKTGMILKAAEEFNIDLSRSWMVGDTTVDVMTGINAQMKSILLMTGEAGLDGKYDVKPDFVCRDLMDAVNRIILTGII